VQAEQYDFAVPLDRWDRPAVRAFRALLKRPDVRQGLAALGMQFG
jgi:molybdate-binding protein